MLLAFVLLSLASCTGKKNETPGTKKVDLSGLVPAGSGIITEIYLHPDTTGDPWEVEKVAGYNGTGMFKDLTEKIYSGELTVYDCITGEKLTPDAVRNIEKEAGSFDRSAGKMIFTEDWYYNPQNGNMEKRIRTVAFGYEQKREGGLPSAWKPLFMLKNE